MSWTEEIELGVRTRLLETLDKLGEDAKAYKPIAESVSAITRDLFDGLIVGGDISEEIKILEATMLQLASAGEAVAAREVKAMIKDTARLVFDIMVKTAIGALGA